MDRSGRKRVTRRDFLKTGLAGLLAPGLWDLRQRRSPFSSFPRPIPRRLLGRTGARVSILGLGGQILLQTPGVTDQAVELINRAIDLGINYCDTAAAYYPSEVYYGHVMATRRHEVFLATKTGNRTRDGAWANLEQSLINLQTDHVDLIQVHSLDNMDHLATILQPNGALAALTEARDQGLVRFIGISSHTFSTLVAALEAFDFDTVLVQANPQTNLLPHVLPYVRRRNMGVIGMKVMQRGTLISASTPASMLLRYTLSQPVSTAIVGCTSLGDLEQNAETARNFTPMSRRVQRYLESLL